MTLPRSFSVYIGILIFVLGSAISAEGEIIRLALFTDVESMTVSAPDGLLMKASSREPWRAVHTTIYIASTAEGVRVNGVAHRAASMEFRGAMGTLRINDQWIRGPVEIKTRNGRLLVVTPLEMEEYLLGVVMAEVPSNWPIEALKAQAVAARTYALYQKRKQRFPDYDLVATTQDQVYRAPSSYTPAGGHAIARDIASRAVQETRGQVMVFDGVPILSAFHSTAAGQTEESLQVWKEDLPYLRGVECPWDQTSKYYLWERAVSLDHIERQLRSSGYDVAVIASISPLSWTKSGRVGSIRIIHSDGELLVRGEEFRKIIGYTTLLSTRFEIEDFGREVVFRGQGAGHGVGLCQWGAKELAEVGFSYQAILHYYYPGAELTHVNELR